MTATTTRPVSMYPRSIFFGFENGLRVAASSKRVIELSPVIDVCDRRGGEIIIPWKSVLSHYRVAVTGKPPRNVAGATTDFSFEITVTPVNEEPYAARFFFESVEWKDVSGGWEWTGDPDWDEYVAERMSGEWPKPVEFLGLARYIDGPSRDPQLRDWGSKFREDERSIGGWYRLPPLPKDG